MWLSKFLNIFLELLEILNANLLLHGTTLSTSKKHRSLEVVWKLVAKLFKHLAPFLKPLDIVEGLGGAEQRLFIDIWAEVGVFSGGKSSVKLLSYEEGE